jgi:hypothetical protein
MLSFSGVYSRNRITNEQINSGFDKEGFQQR